MLLYIDKNTELIGVFDLVGERGLEPPTLAGPVPKTGAYTNSAILAFFIFQKSHRRPGAESNRRIRVLQTLVLPLDDQAFY